MRMRLRAALLGRRVLSGSKVLTTPMAKVCTTDSSWVNITANLGAYANQTVTLQFLSHDDNHAGDATYTRFDDISLAGSAPPTLTPTPGLRELISNGGFETGTASPWTTTTGVVNTSSTEPPHSGSWDAWLCGYGTARTDTLAQTVSIPSTATTAQLSYWLHIDTAETTTTTAYDTFQLQVRSSSGAVLSTPSSYSNLNAAGGYQQHVVDLSAYHGQTIQVYFVGSEDYTNQTSFVVDDVSLMAA